MVVHSALPDALTTAVDSALRDAGVAHAAHGGVRPMRPPRRPPRTAGRWPAGVAHAAHGGVRPMRAAETAAADRRALALIGPYRSADVAEAVEATAPVGLALLAPVATWAGVTREDDPGCDDAARHRGTVLRLVGRDTEVAARNAADARRTGGRAFVVAGEHDYGRQLDGQLRLAGLPRADDPAHADVVVLCGLAGEAEIERVATLAPLPVIAFDGVRGADLGGASAVSLALPVAPTEGLGQAEHMAGVGQARRAAQLVLADLRGGAGDRLSVLRALRGLGPFDDHGDPVDPAVWLWRADPEWVFMPERPLAGYS